MLVFPWMLFERNLCTFAGHADGRSSALGGFLSVAGPGTKRVLVSEAQTTVKGCPFMDVTVDTTMQKLKLHVTSLKIGRVKRKVVIQPSIFEGYVSFREAILYQETIAVSIVTPDARLLKRSS